VGEGRYLEIDGYDPLNKKFTSDIFNDDGSRYSGVLMITGTTRTYVGKTVLPGETLPPQRELVLAPDLASGTCKEETSLGGKMWIPYGESRWTKTKPAPRK